ncbi:MAG: SH3 domain-containing protein [Spirochaetia bacterium]|nr:SH3 domain-containing protein [Spirochaetia bacterium]
MKQILKITIMLTSGVALASAGSAHGQGTIKGTCINWSEGDAQSMISCKASTLDECSKGRQTVDVKETAFQNYTGKLFRAPGAQDFYEFKHEPADSCRKQSIKAARDAEGTMCSEWGYVVYSDHLKAGDKAYVYGTAVTIREKPSTKSNRVGTPADRAPLKILGKSASRETVQGLMNAYWFHVQVDGKKGWIYGQFVHPDPNSESSFISGGN